MKPLAPNTLLQNRYLLVQLIGKGGMGEVYLAVDQRLGSAVALKRTYFSDDKTLVNAFEREARTLARLRHSVLPKVIDHFSEDDTQYLVMEHISGDDLAKRLEDAKSPFPLKLVLLWADELLDALAYLHTHGPPIVHRDIKPQNMKLTDEDHIVLLDFGLVKNSKAQVGVASASIVGYTPHYAPMEQIRGTGTNAKTDIYSLSATLYQFLTFKVPPDALTRADVQLNNLPDPTIPISTLNAEVPKAISDVILKGMSLNSDHRYANAREMQKALHEAYSQTQNILSVQTLIFNEQTNAHNQSISQSRPQAEQSSVPTAILASDHDTPPTPQVLDSDSSQKAEDIHVSPSADSYSSKSSKNLPPDFNDSMPDESVFLSSETKILPPEESSRVENISSAVQRDEFIENEIPSDPKEKFNPDEIVSLKTNISQGDEVLPSAKVNLLSKAEGKNSSANAYASDINVSKTPPQTYPQVDSFENKAKKKSAGKSLSIAGGISGFAVVAIGAAAIGWHALKPSQTSVNPTTMPEAVISASPSVEPTAALVIETNTNINDSSAEIVPSNTSITNTGNSTDTTKRSINKIIQPTPMKIEAAQRTATVSTPAKNSLPVKKPVVNKKTESDSTRILQ